MSVVYPTTPVPRYPFRLTSSFKTIVTEFETGLTQRRKQWRFPRRKCSLAYTNLTDAQVQLLWTFYRGRAGAYLDFLFYCPYETTRAFTDEYVGRGDGTTTTFDIPGHTTSAQTLYLDGAAVAGGDLTILTGTGDGSSDQVVFDSAPTSGALITVDFTGYLRIWMMFASDEMSEELWTHQLFNAGIELVENKQA